MELQKTIVKHTIYYKFESVKLALVGETSCRYGYLKQLMSALEDFRLQTVSQRINTYKMSTLYNTLFKTLYNTLIDGKSNKMWKQNCVI